MLHELHYAIVASGREMRAFDLRRSNLWVAFKSWGQSR